MPSLASSLDLARPAVRRLAIAGAALGCFLTLTGFGSVLGGDLSPIPFFPSLQGQNDALCQSYGYRPGSRMYALCRQRKDKIGGDSYRMASPDTTPIPLLLFVNPQPIH